MAYRVGGDNVSPCGDFKRRLRLEKGVPGRQFCLVTAETFLEENEMTSSR